MPARRLEGGYNGCALNCSIIKVVTPLQLRHLALRIVVWSEPTATRRKRRNTSNAHSTMSFIPQSLKPRRFSSGAQIAVRIVFSGSYTNFTDSCSARQFPYYAFSRIYSDGPISVDCAFQPRFGTRNRGMHYKPRTHDIEQRFLDQSRCTV